LGRKCFRASRVRQSQDKKCYSRLSEKSEVQRAEFITFWGKKTFGVSTKDAVCDVTRLEWERETLLLGARTEMSRPPPLPSVAASAALRGRLPGPRCLQENSEKHDKNGQGILFANTINSRGPWPPNFYAILLRAGTNPWNFHQKFSSRFFLNSHDVEIPIRPHVKFQKIISLD
jgi:hypothetical protein